MGNEQSSSARQQHTLIHRTSSSGSSGDKRLRSPDHYAGLPFVVWNGQHHFAEPSSYKYNSRGSQVQGHVVFVDPIRADNELRNADALAGNIAVVERGGRVHFPDIIRRLIKAGVTGCIFIEREAYFGPKMLFEGFHSSGRQSVDIPIVRLSKHHADQFMAKKPSKVVIEFLRGPAALERLEADDIPFGISTASRLGETAILRSLLLSAQAKLSIKKRGTTALHNAARSGHGDCLATLIDAKADLDVPSDQRRHIEEAVGTPGFTVMDLIGMSDTKDGVSIDILKREVLRNPRTVAWLEEPHVIFDVLRQLTAAPPCTKIDPLYGAYKAHHFCCQVALWYGVHVFERNGHVDLETCVGYFKVLFNFLCRPGELDPVLVILFCDVVNCYVNHRGLGPAMVYFLGTESAHIVPWLVCHIGLDSIRDSLVWLLYSDLSKAGQGYVAQSGLFGCMLDRLYSWQRTLSWGVGTAYQRDSVENICSLLKYIVFPPSVCDAVVFVENHDLSLPLITARTPPGLQNELLRTLLAHLCRTDHALQVFLDLGYAELTRQVCASAKLPLEEGGALSVLMMLMSTLGYHKKKRDVACVEGLLRDVHCDLTTVLVPRVASMVALCKQVVAKPGKTGNTLLCLVTFLKRCIFLQHGALNASLASAGCMPVLMSSFESNPTNSMLHHEVTDIIRFVLLDPDQKRLPSCPLLNSLFVSSTSLLLFVMKSYHARVQYKGHMTTIANSIFTLIKYVYLNHIPQTCVESGGCCSTPSYKDKSAITCQELVRQYTLGTPEWAEFETVLAKQNAVEMTPLGQRHAPLCSGCISLKESSSKYVTSTLGHVERMSGYLETIFSGAATFHCKVNVTDDSISGFMYKKDKIHDHIPVPEPTRVSSFIQFPVPMPFHALTFTLTYVGLCRKCDKLWYCDTLHSGTANWTTRMKWVIPTSVRKWYSFGASAGPGGGAHGIQFTTKGYKNFLVMTDTWGRQEQWIHAIEDAIEASLTNIHVSSANALAIEIDNDADNSTIDAMKKNETGTDVGEMRKRAQTVGTTGLTKELDLKMFQKSITFDVKTKPMLGMINRLPPRFQTDPNEAAGPMDTKGSIRHTRPYNEKHSAHCHRDGKWAMQPSGDSRALPPESRATARPFETLPNLNVDPLADIEAGISRDVHQVEEVVKKHSRVVTSRRISRKVTRDSIKVIARQMGSLSRFKIKRLSMVSTTDLKMDTLTPHDIMITYGLFNLVLIAGALMSIGSVVWWSSSRFSVTASPDMDIEVAHYLIQAFTSAVCGVFTRRMYKLPTGERQPVQSTMALIAVVYGLVSLGEVVFGIGFSGAYGSWATRRHCWYDGHGRAVNVTVRNVLNAIQAVLLYAVLNLLCRCFKTPTTSNVSTEVEIAVWPYACYVVLRVVLGCTFGFVLDYLPMTNLVTVARLYINSSVEVAPGVLITCVVITAIDGAFSAWAFLEISQVRRSFRLCFVKNISKFIVAFNFFMNYNVNMVFALVVCGHGVSWLVPTEYYVTKSNVIQCTGATAAIVGFRLTIVAWLLISMYACLPADAMGLRGWIYSSPGGLDVKTNRVRYFVHPSDVFQTANFNISDLLKHSSSSASSVATIDPRHFVLEGQIEMFNFAYLAYACGHKDYSQEFMHLDNMIGDKRFGLVDHIHEPHNDTHCLIVQSPDKIVVAFRGTTSWKNFRTDFNAARREYKVSFDHIVDTVEPEYRPQNVSRVNCCKRKYPWVHEGFWVAYQTVAGRVLAAIECLHSQSPRPVYVTGHSLGGALAILCSLDVALKWGSHQVTCTTFGCPRVGGNAFKKLYNAHVPATFRFVNSRDPICHSPIRTLWDSFTEVGTTVLLNDFGNMIINPNMLEYSMLNRGVSMEAHKLTFYQLSLLLWCTRAHGRTFEPQFWPHSLQQLRWLCGHIPEVLQYLSRSSLLGGGHPISEDVRLLSILRHVHKNVQPTSTRLGIFKREVACLSCKSMIESLVENAIVPTEAEAVEVGRILLAKGRINMVGGIVFNKHGHFVLIQDSKPRRASVQHDEDIK
ncbi:hypothetical protein DYB25_007232 [Aphanomyces astaci]|uniref:Fungal lipase-type domain-containing protein n=1 Tax=Aphanomyces astaci TaxID=112090 RepID=A0A397BMA8_APHAT|nr:hypothetical protein DYB25_007232 [Aphanomyces astaci]